MCERPVLRAEGNACPHPPSASPALASAALAVAGITILAPTAAQANPAGTDLVINEAYLNGGSAGATYLNRYVELYNPTG